MVTGSKTHRAGRPLALRAVIVAGVLLIGTVGLASCSAVEKVDNAVHLVEGNKATIDAFTTKLQSGSATTFEATYVTTGSAPATIVYAVKPPTGVAFDDVPSGGTGDTTPVHLVVNSSGEFACSQTSGSWSCEKLGTADAATQNEIFDFYTPSHWVGFLRDFSLAAGIAGDKVTSSTMTLNGFPMSCVDFAAPGTPGTSTICSTAQGILGYVNIAGDAVSFEIKSYTNSPPASVFQLPPGATVSTIPPAPSSTPAS